MSDAKPGKPRSVPKKRTADSVLRDPTVPMPIRLEMLKELSRDSEAEESLVMLLEAGSLASAGEQAVAKAKLLAELIQQLQEGPLRCAIFDREVQAGPLGPRAEVILSDGTPASCVVPDAKLRETLRSGDLVWLDQQGRALLYHRPGPVTLGEVARLERRLANGDVEVSLGELSRMVCRASDHLRQQLESGEAAPGSKLIACPRRMFAFQALPREDGLAHLEYLSRQGVPEVSVERDVGAPPAFIEQISRHVRRQLSDPELGARYRLRPSRLLLATGVAGSGKTHSILALWRRLYEIMSELTGAAIDELPPRVLRLDAARVLSKWVGSSDRNIARFFDEVEQVAAEPFVSPDGREWELPVLVICEEIDALARRRGHDAVFDRIQTTLLERLDPSREVFRRRLAIVVCTSNVPSILDGAFVRRAGGMVVSFGRLGRFEFRAVLEKHLRDRPLQDGPSSVRGVVAELTSFLFAPNGSDPGQVELAFVGQPNPVVKYRRDFLTAGLVDRAVQQACLEACDAEWAGEESPGLSTGGLIRALDAQVRHVAEQLTPESCDQYLTLPDALRVGSVRRIEQPAVLPIELERVRRTAGRQARAH